MKYLLCAVFATLYVAASADNIMDRASHVLEHRERTGHFNEYPYADLYKNYVQVFIAPQFKGTDVHETDSYRNYAASAEHCFNVFDLLIDNEYRVEKLEKLVELDSCLGYLYDQEYVERYHAKDKSRPIVAEKLDRYINDPKLKAFYDGTQIDKLELGAKLCVGELLLKTIQIKHQYTDLACNNHHIQLLNNFGDCHKEIPQDIVPNDTYLSVLYQLIKTKGEECFNHELLATNDAVRGEYKNNLWRKVKGWTPQGKQLQKRMWPYEMRRLLAAVQAADKDDLINLREILAFARATYKRVEEPQNRRYVSTLLNNMAQYATKNIDMKKVSTSLGVQDEDGRIRYKNLVDDLCFYFRSTDYEGNYDYATAFARLVHMLDYPELYGITQKKFIETILNSGETAPTYTSIMICNIITYTQGSIVRSTTKREPRYRVTFKADTTGMIRWPDAGFF